MNSMRRSKKHEALYTFKEHFLNYQLVLAYKTFKMYMKLNSCTEWFCYHLIKDNGNFQVLDFNYEL